MTEKASLQQGGLGGVPAESAAKPKRKPTRLYARAVPLARHWAMMSLLVFSDLCSVSLAWGVGMGLRFVMFGDFDYPRYFRLWPGLFIWVLTLAKPNPSAP